MSKKLAEYKSIGCKITLKDDKSLGAYKLTVNIRQGAIKMKRELYYKSFSKANRIFDIFMDKFTEVQEGEQRAETVNKVLQAERSGSYETVRVESDKK